MTKINWYIFRLSPLNSNLCTLRELFDVDLRRPLGFRWPSSSFRSKNDHQSSFRRHTTKYTWIKFIHTNKLNFKIFFNSKSIFGVFKKLFKSLAKSTIYSYQIIISIEKYDLPSIYFFRRYYSRIESSGIFNHTF